jgi:hypothetical protein
MTKGPISSQTQVSPLKAISAPIVGERDLWRLWESRRLPVEMSTRDGRRLRILFPGLANTGAGPDYSGAHIALAGESPRRGDVELHIRATSWEGHGHHRNANYNGVILHVVLEDDGGTAMTEAGLSIPVLALAPFLAGLGGPREASSSEGPCQSAEARRIDHAQCDAVLEAAGLARFTARTAFWESELHAGTVEDVVLRALLRAAGMGGNREACSALAVALDGTVLEWLLRGSLVERHAVAAAALLGMGGLLDQARAGQDIREAWARQRALWPGRPLDLRRWQRFRHRPSNLPETRLQIIATILARGGLRGMLGRLADLVDREEPLTTTELLEPLMPEGSGAGRSWALEAWTNTMLPVLAALGPTLARPRLTDRATRTYAALPGGGDNRILTRMRGIAGLATTPRSAISQQGLLHIWEEHCSRQDCRHCPLAEASRQTATEFAPGPSPI